jgi:hypothetical protein
VNEIDESEPVRLYLIREISMILQREKSVSQIDGVLSQVIPCHVC